MKKYWFLGLVLLAMPRPVSAKCLSDEFGSFFNKICFPTEGDAVDIVIGITNALFGLGAALSVLFLVIGGIRYITSMGNPNQVEAAKNTITNAAVGLAVTLLTLVVLNTVLKIFS